MNCELLSLTLLKGKPETGFWESTFFLIIPTNVTHAGHFRSLTFNKHTE